MEAEGQTLIYSGFVDLYEAWIEEASNMLEAERRGRIAITLINAEQEHQTLQ